MLNEISKAKNIHFIGIGGCGMSAIAKILKLMGYQVSGSDVKESANTIRLRDLGVKIFFRHAVSNLRSADLVVISSAITKENVELQEALSLNLPVFKRAELLSFIMRQFKTSIAVTGTHGKTTTTSMIAWILERAMLDPSYLIGGEANDIEGNARKGESDYVVVEADESDQSHLLLSPTMSVITNVEGDHLENYHGSVKQILASFVKYAQNVSPEGLLLIGVDLGLSQPLIDEITKFRKVLTYGLREDAFLRAVNISYRKNYATFDVLVDGKKLGKVKLSIPGEQNVLNSLAAIYVALELGCEFPVIAAALTSFRGAGRRFERLGEIDQILLIDDYAHHPTEVAVTLAGIRRGWPERKLTAIFQPHRYTRTMFLKDEFRDSFDAADEVIITDVYSAGEDPISGISGDSVFEVVKEKIGAKAVYVPRKEKISDYVIENISDDEIIVTMGAGDITSVGLEIKSRLRALKDDRK